MKDISKSLLILIFLSALNHLAFAFNPEHLDAIKKGKWIQYAILNSAPLQGHNLDHATLGGSWTEHANFTGSSLVEANLCGTIANNADFKNTNLKKANLSYGFFKGACFFNANLEDTIVEGSTFENASGLTNQQKEYLRENGGLNVPKDIPED